MKDLEKIIGQFEGVSVLVIGDIILDTFVYGSVSRISPEGPIPVLAVSREKKMLGGAGNVFSNLQDLGVSAQIISLVGQDREGDHIAQIISDKGGNPSFLIEDAERPTTLKTRYQARSQQLLRVDNEKLLHSNASISKVIIEKYDAAIQNVQAVVISDYGKGMLTPEILAALIQKATAQNIPVIVDPKGRDYRIYKGASVVTPNRKELSEATFDGATDTDDNVEKTARALMKQSGVHAVLATRSEDGMTLVEGGDANVTHLPTKALEVFDVSGAGDTVVATVAAVMATGANLKQAATLANIAGGLVVAKVGTATVQPREMLAELKQQSIDPNRQTPERSFLAKILEKDEALTQVQIWKEQGLKVGFTNGCFDILHYGHVNYLNQARAKCDRLVLGLNHDASVKLLKGESRPINDQMARATVIGALGSVDLVVFFGATKAGEDNTPCEIVGYLKPDILMKGGDYSIDDLPEGKVALSYGGTVEIMPLYEGYSTTNTIEKMKA